jgi:hypothetical protein
LPAKQTTQKKPRPTGRGFFNTERKVHNQARVRSR